MRGLHGLLFADERVADLKRQALLFDKFLIWRSDGLQPSNKRSQMPPDVDYLIE